MDHLTAEARSALMSRIRGRDTKPELAVRRTAHAMGYRFRLHRRDLPGTPDLVFRSRRLAVFVHGCFWHNHDCPKSKAVKSNAAYWEAKLARNAERDGKTELALIDMGWRVLTIWECETRDVDALAARLQVALGDRGTPRETGVGRSSAPAGQRSLDGSSGRTSPKSSQKDRNSGSSAARFNRSTTSSGKVA